MDAEFKTSDQKEQLRIIKSLDMACFIFELKNNAWRGFENNGYDYEPAWEKINELLDYHKIDIDELID